MPSPITPDMLRAWPLPMPSPDGDKEARGHALIIGGSAQMPGAVLLAANAALRAGAGKLSVASPACAALALGIALPEARVCGLAETAQGGLVLEHSAALTWSGEVDAILIGPGMCDEAATIALVRQLLAHLAAHKPEIPVILDAMAMKAVGADVGLHAHLLLTPHAGELAGLSGAEKDDIAAAPEPAAREAARRWQATVALKGALTIIANPAGETWSHQGGNVGLAISGSGDALAGIIVGLAARGAPLAQAACFGVAVHAAAGEQLAQRVGPLGYLAREIADEVAARLCALLPDDAA
ncbi:MAG: NAD(P)H-hydrate dehydratase [Massilia sp.]